MTSVLTELLHGVASGTPPPADGRIEVVARTGDLAGVLAFTAHHVVVADVDAAWVHAQLPDDDLIAPMGPAFLGALAARLGHRTGSLDVVLVAAAKHGPGPTELVEMPANHDHPRVQRARRHRQDLRVWSPPDGRAVLAIGRGLGGRWEASFEVDADARGAGLGRTLASAARHLVPTTEHVWVQVAPGNVPSLRAVLAAGYAPVGAETLFVPT